MKLTARLALSQLKVNKRRTIWTFLGIVLSTAMLTTIYNLGYGTGMRWVDNITYHSDLRDIYFAIISAIAMTLSIFVISISIIVISNAFRVSASERLAQFGILKSTGATKKQITLTVVYEGLYLTVIAVPVGVLIGLAFQLLSIGLINDVIEPMLSVEDQESGRFLFEFILSIGGLLLTIGVSLLTVFLSAWLPARKAAKVPAINAIRGTGEVKIKNKKVRRKGILHKIFKTEGLLARIFLKRSSRNFKATVIAMSFSVAIFIIAGSFYSQISRFAEVQWGEVEANAEIRLGISSNRQVDCDDFDETVPGAHWYYATHTGSLGSAGHEATRFCYMPIDDVDFLTVDRFNDLHTQLDHALDDGDQLFGIAEAGWDTSHELFLHRDHLTDDMLYFRARSGWEEYDEEGHRLDVSFIVVNDAFATELAELAGVERGSNIVINHGRGWTEDNRVVDFEILNFNYQILRVDLWGDQGGQWRQTDQINVPLHGQITPEQAPSQLLRHGWWGITVIIPESHAPISHVTWYIQTDDSAGAIEIVEELLLAHFEYDSAHIWSIDRDADEAMMRNTIGLVMFFMFSFVGVLILIGLTNVVSTISENVKTRSKEFAVLQSVGMTGSGIKRMLNLESVFSSLHALLIGVPLGFAGSYGIYMAIENAARFDFYPLWTWAIISITAVFITTWLTMRYAANKLKNQNIIETIRSGSGM